MSFEPADFYYLLMGFAVIAHALIYLVITSRLGRAMRAIKLNEALAQSQGINPLSYKLLAIALSALLAGIVGGLFVFYLTIVDPSIFDFYYTETTLIMVILGGPGSFWGVLASSAVLTVVPDMLRFTTDLRMVLYGVVLIVAMIVFPGGFGGWLSAAASRVAPPACISAPCGAMTVLLEVHGLTKHYFGLTAVDNVSYEVEAGNVVGLIGPNGSGKSTSIDCISGFQRCDAGNGPLPAAL